MPLENLELVGLSDFLRQQYQESESSKSHKRSWFGKNIPTINYLHHLVFEIASSLIALGGFIGT